VIELTRQRPAIMAPHDTAEVALSGFANSSRAFTIVSERAFNAALGIKKSPRKPSAKLARAAGSVIEKSDKYDDGNWHAEQPKQYSTAHERLLFDSSLIVAPSKRASIHFVPAKHTAVQIIMP
jgi:hypothetical protein